MRIFALLALVGLYGVNALMPSTASASECTNSTLKGAYGFQATGPQDNSVPPLFFETVGRMSFDGAGTGQSLGTFARSDGAVNPADNHPFTYSVSPSCEFALTWDDGETFSGVIAASSLKLYFIETSGACCGTAIIRRGEATRIGLLGASSCGKAALRGTYGFGSTVTQNNQVPPNFLELAGLFSFDGSGHATTSFSYAQSNGNVGSDGDSLTYQLASNCTFTLVQDNGETFAGVLVGGATEFYFIETSGACCGSAIIRRGRATRVGIDQ